MKLGQFSANTLFNFIKKDDIVNNWALSKTSKYPFTIYYFASTFKFFMKRFFFYFCVLQNTTYRLPWIIVVVFLYLPQKKFLFSFARIDWFLLGKYCILHIGDGLETGKVKFFRKRSLEKYKFILGLHKQTI